MLFFVCMIVFASGSTDFDWRHHMSRSESQRESDLFVIVQLSDTHLSHYNTFSSKQRTLELSLFLNSTIPKIDPDVILLTGDITNGALKTGGTRQNLAEWKDYRRILNNSGLLTTRTFLDVRGNHDSFKVTKWSSPTNFYGQFSVRASAQGNRFPYMHQHKLLNTLKNRSYTYSFIGIDAAPEPGPGGPLNFIGKLNKESAEIFAEMAQYVNESAGVVIFGHYPSPYVRCYGHPSLRNLISIGAYYLCGHLHTVSNTVKHMFLKHSDKLVELELGDWKDNRLFRIGVFDRGVFTFTDFKFSKLESAGVVVLSPKNAAYMLGREKDLVLPNNQQQPIKLMILSFSNRSIGQVRVCVDSVFLGNAVADPKDPKIYSLAWDPNSYSAGIHELAVEVISVDSADSVVKWKQQFSFDQSMIPKMRFGSVRSNFFLNSFDIHVGCLIIHYGIFLFVCIIIFFHYYGPNQIGQCPPQIAKGPLGRFRCFGRSIWLGLTARMNTYFSIKFCLAATLFSTIYYTFGPWAIGEVSDDVYGLVFLWGIVMMGSYTAADMQYVYGTVHFFFLFLPLQLSLVASVFKRKQQMLLLNPDSTINGIRRNLRARLTLENAIFLVFLVLNLGIIYMFEVMYSPSIILSPISAMSYVYLCGVLWIFFQFGPDWAVERAFKSALKKADFAGLIDDDHNDDDNSKSM